MAAQIPEDDFSIDEDFAGIGDDDDYEDGAELLSVEPQIIMDPEGEDETEENGTAASAQNQSTEDYDTSGDGFGGMGAFGGEHFLDSSGPGGAGTSGYFEEDDDSNSRASTSKKVHIGRQCPICDQVGGETREIFAWTLTCNSSFSAPSQTTLS